jgi:hypothetical protein
MPCSRKVSCGVPVLVNEEINLRLSTEQKILLAQKILTYIYASESLTSSVLFSEDNHLYASDLSLCYPEISISSASRWFNHLFGSRSKRTSKPYLIKTLEAVHRIHATFPLDPKWLPEPSQVVFAQKLVLAASQTRQRADQDANRRRLACLTLQRVKTLAQMPKLTREIK